MIQSKIHFFANLKWYWHMFLIIYYLCSHVSESCGFYCFVLEVLSHLIKGHFWHRFCLFSSVQSCFEIEPVHHFIWYQTDYCMLSWVHPHLNGWPEFIPVLVVLHHQVMDCYFYYLVCPFWLPICLRMVNSREKQITSKAFKDQFPEFRHEALVTVWNYFIQYTPVCFL